MKFTVYITKYALTEGILTKSATPCGRASMVQVGNSYFHGEGRDWHKTLDAAKKRAEGMRFAKIRSVKKQLARLEALRFSDASATEESGNHG